YAHQGMATQGQPAQGTATRSASTSFGNIRNPSLGSQGSQGLTQRGTPGAGVQGQPAQGTTTPNPLLQVVANPTGSLGNKGEIEIVLPTATAIVSIDGSPLTGTGTTRYLETGNLPPSSTYTYNVTAT